MFCPYCKINLDDPDVTRWLGKRKKRVVRANCRNYFEANQMREQEKQELEQWYLKTSVNEKSLSSSGFVNANRKS